MRSYGQFCPIARASELFCERWTALILRDLMLGATRFSQLRRGVPLASPTIVSRRLKELEAEGVVERRREGRSWTYHLTPAGAEFAPVVEALGAWGQRWARRELRDDEVNLPVLLWALERNVRPEAFGGRQCVVSLTLTDQNTGRRNWWFVTTAGGTELCYDEPGFEVDLYLTTDLATVIHIYRGDMTPATALARGSLQADGAAWARKALPRWLVPGPFAHLPPQRADARAA